MHLKPDWLRGGPIRLIKPGLPGTDMRNTHTNNPQIPPDVTTESGIPRAPRLRSSLNLGSLGSLGGVILLLSLLLLPWALEQGRLYADKQQVTILAMYFQPWIWNTASQLYRLQFGLYPLALALSVLGLRWPILDAAAGVSSVLLGVIPIWFSLASLLAGHFEVLLSAYGPLVALLAGGVMILASMRGSGRP